MISTLTRDEVAEVLPLFAQVQAVHARAYPWRFRADMDEAGLLADLAAWLAAGHVCLAERERGGPPRGFLLYEVQERAATPLKHAERIGMIHVVSVDGAHRRKGIGRALGTEALARLRDAGVPRWAVSYWAFNEASRALFESLGATPHLTFAEVAL